MRDNAILITGCARSGTSLIAGIVDICGAFGGKVTGPTGANKKGQFENDHIREQVVKPYLRSLGADPLGQDPLPDLDKLIPYKDFFRDVTTPICQEGYQSGPWYYKGAKMCLIWPVWHVAFPKAKWIIVRRTSDNIVRSCLNTGFMRAFHDAEGWSKWVWKHLVRFEEMKDSGLNIREVWSDKLIDGDLSEIQEAIEWAGLEWKEDEVLDFISPELWNFKNG